MMHLQTIVEDDLGLLLSTETIAEAVPLAYLNFLSEEQEMPPNLPVMNSISPRSVEVNIREAVLKTFHFKPSLPSNCQVEIKTVSFFPHPRH